MITIRRKEIVIKMAWLSIFSIAMGYLETAVVVYLRQLYYPEGFRFPLVPIEPGIAITEFFREAATVIMLVGIGILSGKTRWQRFAYFVFCFAVWDIFYYVFLYLLLGWPASLFTWDILFIIPVPWVGPVVAPVLVSATMILFSLAVVNSPGFRITRVQSLLLLSGCVLVLASFLQDYFLYASENGSTWFPGEKEKLFEDIAGYIPRNYNWFLFLSGEMMMLLGVGHIYRNSKSRMLVQDEWNNGIIE